MKDDRTEKTAELLLGLVMVLFLVVGRWVLAVINLTAKLVIVIWLLRWMGVL